MFSVGDPMAVMITYQGLRAVGYTFLIVGFLSCVSCGENGDPDLVAHYSFDGTTADLSGQNKDLLVYGARPVADRFGKARHAYGFDGSSAYMIAGIAGMPNLKGPHSVTWWFQVAATPVFKDSLDAGNMIVLADTTQSIGVQMGYRADGYKTHGFDVWYWGGATVLDSPHPSVSEWHQGAYTSDGKRQLLFIDGLQVAEAAVKPQPGTPTLLMLGNYPGGDQFFSGVLDELRIYRRTLLPSEITAMYSREKAY